MTGYAFPDMLVDVVKLSQSGQRDTAHDLFDAHLPLIRYEQQQGIGLAVRKYVLQKRNAITYDSQRTPSHRSQQKEGLRATSSKLSRTARPPSEDTLRFERRGP